MWCDELIDRGAIADQSLERDLAVQAEPVGQRDEGHDDSKRREPPKRRAGLASALGQFLAKSLAFAPVECLGGCAPIVGRHAHKGYSRTNLTAL